MLNAPRCHDLSGDLFESFIFRNLKTQLKILRFFTVVNDFKFKNNQSSQIPEQFSSHAWWAHLKSRNWVMLLGIDHHKNAKSFSPCQKRYWFCCQNFYFSYFRSLHTQIHQLITRSLNIYLIVRILYSFIWALLLQYGVCTTI